jgi:DNA-binding phage protein
MESGHSLQQVFTSFANGKEMDGKTFAKLCKDCALLDKKLTTTDVDLIFAKIKDKTARKITFDQFKNGVSQIATKKGVSAEDVSNHICSTGGPKFAGTKADFVKFHDDKSTYTGVYAKGGPTNVDAGRGGGVSDISQLCDRTGADVRGVKK